MKNLLIEIKELKAMNYSRTDDSFDVVINFDVNGERFTLNKFFKMDKKYELMSLELVNFVKEHVKSKNKSSLADDFLDSIVVVRYNDMEEVQEKVASFFKRFKDHINNYKSKRYTEGFLTKYSTPDGFSIKIN